MGSNVLDGTRTPVGYESLDDVSTVKGLTPPEGARVAIIQAIDNPVNWRDDGTNPANGNQGGMQLAAGESFLYVGFLNAIKFIETGSTDTADVNVMYYK